MRIGVRQRGRARGGARARAWVVGMAVALVAGPGLGVGPALGVGPILGIGHAGAWGDPLAWGDDLALRGSHVVPIEATDRVLDVLTFNLAFLPAWVADTGQAERAARVAPHLVGHDVLVLQEAFVPEWVDPLLEQLRAAYPHRTEVVGPGRGRGVAQRLPGGVVILSRWPIVETASMLFGDTCSLTDCLADKGVAYAAVRKRGRVFHVFGTHLQSAFGWDPARVRAAQVVALRAFADTLALAPGEVAIVTGDLNVDAFRPEFDRVLAVLGAPRPELVGPERFSWDPATNELAYGPAEHLDHVLVLDGFGATTASWNRVVPLRDDGLDLSDHFAVWGRVVAAPRP